MRADRLAGIATLAAGAGLAIASLAIKTSPAQADLSARFMPLLLSIALIVLGSALAVQGGTRALSQAMRQMLASRALVLSGLLLVYFLTFRYVDFRLSTWLFMLAAIVALGGRRPVELIVVPVVVSLSVYVVFRHGFSVLLPVWM
jgi:putative tricarboxylic transport membrane protein